MKILHVGNLKSGIDTYVRNTVAMASDDFEFVIVCGADDKSEPFMRHGKQVKTYTIGMYRALNPVKDLKAVMQAVRIIRREKPDLVHCHSAKGGVIGRFAALLTGTKVAYTAHAFSFLSAETEKKRKVYLLLEKMARLHSRLLACSESERQLGIKTVGFKAERAYAWNNAIPVITEKDICTPKELDFTEKFIISIGRPSYQKNPLLMVETMRRVYEKHPDVHFYLLGVGFYSPMLAEMKRLIAKHGLENIVKLLPWLGHQETLGYLRQSLFYLTTSLYEGLPIAVLEAMAMGKAVVSSDVIGNNDCVTDGENGFLLSMDANRFAEKCCLLIENEAQREAMGRKSQAIFQTDFEIGRRIKDLESIYTEIINP